MKKKSPDLRETKIDNSKRIENPSSSGLPVSEKYYMQRGFSRFEGAIFSDRNFQVAKYYIGQVCFEVFFEKKIPPIFVKLKEITQNGLKTHRPQESRFRKSTTCRGVYQGLRVLFFPIGIFRLQNIIWDQVCFEVFFEKKKILPITVKLKEMTQNGLKTHRPQESRFLESTTCRGVFQGLRVLFFPIGVFRLQNIIQNFRCVLRYFLKKKKFSRSP